MEESNHQHNNILCNITDQKVLYSAKWIQLKEITYNDPKGVERKWESAVRTTRKDKEIDGIDIVAKVKKEDGREYLITVLQFRPPHNKLVLELPAGLVDGNESAEDSAIRELREETGYITKRVISVSPILGLECGMSSANSRVVSLEVDHEQPPKQCLEDDEFIQVILLPMDNLLQSIADFQKERNCIISAYLYTFALGFSLKSANI
eukprot:gene10113-12405_t